MRIAIEKRRVEYQAYLASAKWQAKRKQALERDGHRCRVCNRDENLDVHHRTYERFGAEQLDDLTVLCRDCHATLHKQRRPVRSKPRKISKQKHANIASGFSREDVRQVPCPTCGAKTGKHCVNKHGNPRRACHQARWNKRGEATQPIIKNRLEKREREIRAEWRKTAPPSPSVQTVTDFFLASKPQTVYTAVEIAQETRLSIAQVNGAIGVLRGTGELMRVGKKGWRQHRSVSELAETLSGFEHKTAA